jgi:hypothetical protein
LGGSLCRSILVIVKQRVHHSHDLNHLNGNGQHIPWT